MTRTLLRDRRRHILQGGGDIAQILATSPLAYWQLAEGGGATIIDSSASGFNGAYTGVTWDGTRHPSGTQMPFFDATNDYGNLYSAGLAAAVDLDEGSLLISIQVDSASVWTDATFRYFINLTRDASNLIEIRKENTNNTVRFRRTGNGTIDTVTAAGFSETGTIKLLLTWSVLADELKAFKNNVQLGATQTGLVAAIGSGLAATQTIIGANVTTPTFVHHGYAGHVALWDRVLTDTERAEVAA